MNNFFKYLSTWCAAGLLATACGGVEAEDLAIEDLGVGAPIVEATHDVRAQPDAVGVTEKGCTIPRSDVNSYATMSAGNFGSWEACTEFCPAGSFAYSVSLRSEGTQGSGDDTGLNGIRLNCYNRSDGVSRGYITSHAGFWGSWLATSRATPYQTNNPFIGGRMKIEPPQGSGDDTSANAVDLTCRNGSRVVPDAATAWGNWQSVVNCPSGTAVCGVKTRVEGQLGNGDDTALNGIQFACCTF